MTAYSSDVEASGLGTTPARSNSTPLCTSSVASPPSSRIMLGPPPSGQRRTCSVHHQYSVEGLALPGEDRDPGRGIGCSARADRDRRGGVVLGGVDVAGGPADLGPQLDQGLDQHGGLDGHVQGAGDPGAGQRLGRAELGAHRHEAGHLVLGEADLVAAELGQGQVGDLEVVRGGDLRCGCHALLVAVRRGTAAARGCRPAPGSVGGSAGERHEASMVRMRRRRPRTRPVCETRCRLSHGSRPLATTTPSRVPGASPPMCPDPSATRPERPHVVVLRMLMNDRPAVGCQDRFSDGCRAPGRSSARWVRPPGSGPRPRRSWRRGRRPWCPARPRPWRPPAARRARCAGCACG